MIVFLAPHNDDESLFGAYTLLRERPHVIVCLRSQRMGTPGYPPPLVDADTREAETEEAMNVLGIEWTQWPVLDSSVDWDELADRMTHLPRVFHRCYAPAVEHGGHVHHNLIGTLALKVFGPGRVTPYLTYTNGTVRSSGGQLVPYEDGWPELKREALDCYRSQAAHPMTGHHFTASLDEFYAL